MARRIIRPVGKLPRAIHYSCTTCKDTGKRVAELYGRKHMADCNNPTCAALAKLLSERRDNNIKADARHLRNTPCEGCANRGYVEYEDGSKAACPMRCRAVPVAAAMGLIEL